MTSRIIQGNRIHYTRTWREGLGQQILEREDAYFNDWPRRAKAAHKRHSPTTTTGMEIRRCCASSVVVRETS